MAFYDTVWWTLLSTLTMTGWLVFIIGDGIRSRHAKGTHGRYVWATIVWAAALPALGFPVMELLEDFATANRAGLVGDSLLIFVWAMNYWMLKRSDDDNWFRRTGKRLRRWLSDRVNALSPLPAGAGA